jgi:hypothetical protein
MKKIIVLSIVALALAFAAFTKEAKYTFTDTITFTDTVKFKSGCVVQDSSQTYGRHAPYHYDTVTLHAGFLSLDTSATTDSMWLKFPASPKNSQEVIINSVAAVTKVFYLSGTSNNANTAFTAGQTVGFIYLSTPAKWYRRI